jgi:nucleotide-binding universal stress UspA family protein
MAIQTHRPVAVGVDGSPSSLAAARYAAELAVRRQAPLLLIYGYQTSLYGYTPLGVPDPHAMGDKKLRAEIDDLLAQAIKDLQAEYPDLVEVRARQIAGGGASVLIDESRRAAVTVVGCRGVGGFQGLLLGSVSTQVAAHAHGPVIVIRPPVSDDVAERPAQPPVGPVLVGFDGSAAAVAALRFGVAEALWRKVELIALHAYWSPLRSPTETVQAQVEAEQLLQDAVRPYAAEHPDLKIETRSVQSTNVEKTMVDAAREAGLTVVGCRGRGGFAGLLLGSVSRTLVHHAYGPVAVIHPSEH